MKEKFIITALFLLIAISQTSALRSITLNDFNKTLLRYGNWIEDENQDLAWLPSIVSRNWQPYTVGRWYWTEFGWFWDSDEPFGWITHHYGRWDYNNQYGWVWYPGYKWAPAWVEWRLSYNHIGWLPLSPDALFDLHDGIYYLSSRSLDFTLWNFVKFNHLKFGSIRYSLVGRHKIGSVYKQTERRIKYYVDNGVIICEGFHPEEIMGYKMVITNLQYTNDFRKIIENDIDIHIRIPRKPRPPCPYPIPPDNPRRPILIPDPAPTPPRGPVPEEVINGRPHKRKPVSETVIVDKGKIKVRKERNTEKKENVRKKITS